MAFVRDSTVFGKRQEESLGYSLLLFYSTIILSIELIGCLISLQDMPLFIFFYFFF